MAYNLRNRHFLKLLNFTPGEIEFLLNISTDLKKAKYAGTEQARLRSKDHFCGRFGQRNQSLRISVHGCLGFYGRGGE
jgi:ornithine carbamoyltransferase